MATWTVKDMLDWCKDYLAEHGDESPLVSAQLLVSHVSGLSRVELYMNYGRVLTESELDQLRPLVKRRGAGEPLQYIFGTAPFRYLDIKVRPGILIPRPETEVLVSEVLAALPAPSRRVASDSLMNEYDGAAMIEQCRAANAFREGSDSTIERQSGSELKESQSRDGADLAVQRRQAGYASDGQPMDPFAGQQQEQDSGFDGISDEEFAAEEQIEQHVDIVVFGSRHADDFNEEITLSGQVAKELPSQQSIKDAQDTCGESDSFAQDLLIADICTGSGCIACSLATERDDVRVVATDISSEAVALARENVVACGVTNRIGVLEGDLGTPIEAVRPHFMGSFDAVVSNPPYVPSGVVATLPSEVADFEPALALDGGADGLDIYRRLLSWSKRALKPGGVFACELHETCLDIAADMARAAEMTDVRIVHDLANRPRVLVCRTREA